MGDEAIPVAVAKAIRSMPGVIGVNNHQSSKATADMRVMKAVLNVIKANSLFFVDSCTSEKSIAYTAAKQMGVKTANNALFIDNETDIAAVLKQLRQAVADAVSRESMVVIDHARLNTAA